MIMMCLLVICRTIFLYLKEAVILYSRTIPQKLLNIQLSKELRWWKKKNLPSEKLKVLKFLNRKQLNFFKERFNLESNKKPY